MCLNIHTNSMTMSIEVKGSHDNQMVVFGQFISQKLVNLHFIWVVGPFGTLKAAWFFRSKRV